jgi:alkylation response protein AidB-like acyl-CoA dehydrogenase
MLIGCGTPEQKAYYLPRILSGEDFWCQGYSEPGSGSDLASLQTFAESDGDDYVINGTKIWTTYAMHANMMFALVRTNREVKPQAGITFLLIDMKTPGIKIDPIVGLDEIPEQCQVFFDNVRVPKKNRVGDENMGWSVAKFLLMFERGGAEYAPALRVQLEKVKQLASRQKISAHKNLMQDEVFTHKIAQAEIDILALLFTENRIKSALASGKDPGALSSMTKILGTELQQKITELAIEALGTQALIWQPAAIVPNSNIEPVGPEYATTAMARYLNARATSIYGGSNEVQRGIIAKMVLGL